MQDSAGGRQSDVGPQGVKRTHQDFSSRSSAVGRPSKVQSFFLDVDDGMGLRQLAAQTLIVFGQLGHPPGFGDAPESALRRRVRGSQRYAFGGLALPTPRCQLR